MNQEIMKLITETACEIGKLKGENETLRKENDYLRNLIAERSI